MEDEMLGVCIGLNYFEMFTILYFFKNQNFNICLLLGEFPCRLCPAVYPNLRALKGHNKEHLGKPPYICNVGTCTYSSNDKSTLTRHMRTHTGEKPFECKLCNYGFTTKANCERHLKNKHGKTSRDAIRTSIIVHESECDPDGKQGIQNASDANSGIIL